MSTESEDDAKTISEWTLHDKLLKAFHEAKARGLSWHDCEAMAELANSEVFLEGSPPQTRMVAS
jgi:hypothetical protein